MSDGPTLDQILAAKRLLDSGGDDPQPEVMDYADAVRRLRGSWLTFNGWLPYGNEPSWRRGIWA